MDIKRRSAPPPAEVSRPAAPPSIPAERPAMMRAPSRIEAFPDSGPKAAMPPATRPVGVPNESPGLWSRIKSFFGGTEASKAQMRDVAAKPQGESLEEGWVNLNPERSYKLPEGVKMEDVDKELESLSDEMFTDEPSDEDKMLAELEASLPSPPKTMPKAEDDLTARLNRLREGYVPTSSEAQLSARLRDLTNSNIPSLETGLANISARRVNPQTSTAEQIRAQSTQFMQGLTGMTRELLSYSGANVDPKAKLDASKYAARIADRVGTESKLLGNSIAQIAQRKDLSASEKQSLISELQNQMATLKKSKTQLQQFRFDMTKQANDAVKRQSRK